MEYRGEDPLHRTPYFTLLLCTPYSVLRFLSAISQWSNPPTALTGVTSVELFHVMRDHPHHNYTPPA